MTGIEAHRQLAIANNWGESWFERDMAALAEAKAAHQDSESHE
jgi:hypothetical protein